jgi:hypothetical protein
MPTNRKFRIAVASIGLLLMVTLAAPGVDPLPAQLSDEAFWRLFTTLSEPGGVFSGENYVSNEPRYAELMSELQKAAKPGGVYIGVGPEQNFNYIAAIRPKMAFIVDIRRQNAVEHLMYRALFELSPDRATFLSRLFSRNRPQGLLETSTVNQLMRAYAPLPEDSAAFARTLEEVRKKLGSDRGFALTGEDFAAIEKILKVFSQQGTGTNYASDSAVGLRVARGEVAIFPTYAALMEAADSSGKQWSFLSTEANYRFVRDMETNGMIVPVVGDFAGPQALRGIGQYLKDHGAIVTAFYTSNVEDFFLQPRPPALGIVNGGWTNYVNNVRSLPSDDNSVFVRWRATQEPGRLGPLRRMLQAAEEGRIRTTADLMAVQ